MTRVLQISLSLAVLALGGGVATLLVVTRPQAAQAPPGERAVPVDVRVVHPAQRTVVVHASGTVEPVHRVSLQPEVSGRVEHVGPGFDPGAVVREGQVLVQIDDRDLRSAVAAQQAAVARARVALREETTQRAIAEKEWAGVELGEDAEGYALREPHLASARANLRSAQAELARARRNLARAKIRAPFDAVVLARNVDVGQVVGPGALLGTLAGTSAFWVRAFVPVGQLAWLDVPPARAAGARGSKARVRLDAGGGEPVVRAGAIERLAGEVDARSKQAQVLVRVDDPMGVDGGAGGGAPLLLGSYVSVEIEGRSLPDVYTVPAHAVLDGDRVWVVDESSRLASRSVQVIWREGTEVFVRGGLRDGDRVVTSPSALASEGMLVAPREAGAEAGLEAEATAGARSQADTTSGAEPAPPVADPAPGSGGGAG